MILKGIKILPLLIGNAAASPILEQPKKANNWTEQTITYNLTSMSLIANNDSQAAGIYDRLFATQPTVLTNNNETLKISVTTFSTTLVVKQTDTTGRFQGGERETWFGTLFKIEQNQNYEAQISFEYYSYFNQALYTASNLQTPIENLQTDVYEYITYSPYMDRLLNIANDNYIINNHRIAPNGTDYVMGKRIKSFLYDSNEVSYQYEENKVTTNNVTIRPNYNSMYMSDKTIYANYTPTKYILYWVQLPDVTNYNIWINAAANLYKNSINDTQTFIIEMREIEGHIEVIDIPGLCFTILTMPFTFISMAFNLTIFPGTPYALNLSNLFLSIIGILVFIFLIKQFLNRS